MSEIESPTIQIFLKSISESLFGLRKPMKGNGLRQLGVCLLAWDK